MIAGIATLGGGYLFTALVGMTMLSQDSTEPGTTCVNCESVGSKLLIPVIGPFLAIPEADGSDGKVVATMLGAVQVAGLVMTIAGIAQFASSGPSATTREARRSRDLNFVAAPLPSGGGFGALRGSF
jgi:hypothetical protein